MRHFFTFIRRVKRKYVRIVELGCQVAFLLFRKKPFLCFLITRIKWFLLSFGTRRSFVTFLTTFVTNDRNSFRPTLRLLMAELAELKTLHIFTEM